jgi:hypothetical protein
MAKKHGEKAIKNKALGYDTDELEEEPPMPPRKPRKNPFISSDESEDIPREAKKMAKGMTAEREDKHDDSDAKKKGKAVEREESPVDKKDLRRSPRKKAAQSKDESDIPPITTRIFHFLSH